MYTEPKFLAMKDKSKAKRMAELLRVIILQLGDDVPRAKREFETYAGWMKLPESERLTGKNQAQMIDLYKTFRTRAGLGFERDVYLEQEPGDREVPNEKPISFAVLVHNLRSAFNVGSIIRSTDCFGLEGVHLSGYSCGPDHVTVKSAARGCQEWIPIKRWESPMDCIKWHKENGYEIITGHAESHYSHGRAKGQHERGRGLCHHGILFTEPKIKSLPKAILIGKETNK